VVRHLIYEVDGILGTLPWPLSSPSNPFAPTREDLDKLFNNIALFRLNVKARNRAGYRAKTPALSRQENLTMMLGYLVQ